VRLAGRRQNESHDTLVVDTRAWSVAFLGELMLDTELLDWVCENNKYFDVLPKER